LFSDPADSAGAGGNRLWRWAPDEWPLADDWRPLWQSFLASPAGQGLARRLSQRLRDGAVVYPAHPLRALQLTALSAVRVVILGQDPYHGPGQAEGLAFSVPAGVPLPPSLRNIFKEVARDAGGVPAGRGGLQGSLLHWAQQGVLLLNASLTVEAGAAGSHAGWGWEDFTGQVLAACAQEPRPKAFVLWGAHAQARGNGLDATRHLVLRANHPSPLSATRGPAPFVGCGHFAAVNRWLSARGEKNINWL